MNAEDHIHRLTAHLFRENSGKMTAVLSRMFGLNQIDLVMDVVQDSFEAALQKWKFSGVPDNPSSWLMQVAKNKAINAYKKENKMQALSPSVYMNHTEDTIENQFNLLLSPKEIKDSQLLLLFTCCHPDLSTKNQIILTLHVLCGFGVPEIAGALLMQEEAVKKALLRSKSFLRGLGNIMLTSRITRLDQRFNTVLTILYLMFNEGYKTTRSTDAINNDLCFEAIRLTRLLENENGEGNSEIYALLALMFFNLSRFPARLTSENEWLTLAEQDRNLWNKVFIEEGCCYLNKATGDTKLTRYHLEAIIASIHCLAATFEETDWEKITWLYQQLERVEPASPLITLNRIIAESYLSNSNCLQVLNTLESQEAFKNHFLLAAAKGDIYKRKGEMQSACKAYEQALSMAVSPIDKKFLQKKISQCLPHKN